MHPILFQYRRIKAPSYTVMLYLGLVAGIFAGNAAAHASRTDAYHVFVATLLLVVAALGGGRALYVTSHWSLYRRNPADMLNRSQGGMSLYGGLILAMILSIPILTVLRLGWGEFWDTAAFTILTGMIFTRAGCYLNGCCCGRKTQSRFGWRLTNTRGESARRIPVQLMEAVWAAILLVLAVIALGRLPWPGALFLLLLGGYACGRIVIDPLREREPGAPRIRIERAISYAALAASFLILWASW